MQEHYLEVRTVNYKDNLFRKLSDLRNQEGLPMDIFELENDAQYLIRCVYRDSKGKHELDGLTIRVNNYYFARALAEIIFQRWEGFFVRKVLKNEYSINKSELEKIFLKACNFLDNEQSSVEPRKHVLIKSILEFLDSHQRFDIEGFMNFRADLYKRELKKIIAKAVSQYALELEHESFICLLKRFLNSQRSIYKTIHIVFKEQGEVFFYDDRGRNINDECLNDNCLMLNEFSKDNDAEDIKSNMDLYDDFLISVLLRCAPNRLIIHLVPVQHTEIIQIIQEVFGEKVSLCTGCSLCRQTN